MSKRELKLYLDDILTSISKIEEYIQGLSFDDFNKNILLQDAVIRRLEIIGEAAKNIPQDFAVKHPDIPWAKIISMRNKVIHEYFGVDVDILWKTITEDLSELKENIKRIV